MIVVYFLSGECVDDVASNQIDHYFTSIIVEHFTNSARMCWIIRRIVFNVYACLNHICRHEHNQYERRYGKPRHQRQFFQNLNNVQI